MARKTKAQIACEDWNKNPVGTEVTLTRDNGQIEHTKTRSTAYVSASGHAVIFLENVSGYYLLDRVRKKGEPPAVAP